jgi:predicted MFS family arabinose efflux permease
MSLPMTIPGTGLAVTVVVAGLYILSLLLTALTSRPPAIRDQDSRC